MKPLSSHNEATRILVASGVLGFGVSGTTPTPGFWTPVFHAKPQWLTGGAFGLEASLPCAVLCLLAIVSPACAADAPLADDFGLKKPIDPSTPSSPTLGQTLCQPKTMCLQRCQAFRMKTISEVYRLRRYKCYLRKQETFGRRSNILLQ